MPVYHLTDDAFVPLEETRFSDVKVRERQDLQRLLREKIDVLDPDLLVIGEEFCDWENSRRRIDLLAVDQDANLVVVELKRTDDGGHMELQAIRYAAMVAPLTFAKAVDVFAAHLNALGGTGLEAEQRLLEFLGWEDPSEDEFGQDVRILLVSADFSREVTTSVMWLNERGLDIRCIRMRPYKYEDRVLVDVEQVIPLPEAQEYQIRIREKMERERVDRVEKTDRMTLRYQFWQELLDRAKGRTQLHSGISPSKDGWISAGAGKSGVHLVYSAKQHAGRAAVILEFSDAEVNKRRFDVLSKYRSAIEGAVSFPLVWDRGNEKKTSYVRVELTTGGYRSDRTQWPEIQDEMITTMIELEAAVSPYMDELE
jgi:hypothetical protein